MEKIPLSSNHKRAVSSSIYLIGQLADEIEDALNNTNSTAVKAFYQDIPENKQETIRKTIAAVRNRIIALAEKYQLDQREIIQSHYVTARKVKMWEVLNDTRAKRLKGFGDFPEKYTVEFDKDIQDLVALIEKI